MYFYIIEGGTYDSSEKDIYYSETYYSQNEFENIVIEGYKYVCEEVECKKDDFRRCYEDFDPEDICWLSEFGENDFVKWIEKNTDLRIINKGTGYMDIGTGTTPTDYTKKLKESIDKSKIPDCRNNCKHKDDEDDYYIGDCYYYKKYKKNLIKSFRSLY